MILDANKTRITERIITLDYQSIVANNETIQIERHDDAIKLLDKYHDADSCIVCDNPTFNADALLATKIEKRNRIYDNLDQQTKDLLDKVVRDTSLAISDPFDIKRIVSEFIAGKSETELVQLQSELILYVHTIGDEMIES